MAMFDDPKKELKKLEEQLLKEEEWFETELQQAKALLGEEAAPKKKKPAQTPAAPQSPEKKADKPVRPAKTGKEAPAPKKRKSNRGLVILACLETLGIVGVVAYWLVFLL